MIANSQNIYHQLSFFFTPQKLSLQIMDSSSFSKLSSCDSTSAAASNSGKDKAKKKKGGGAVRLSTDPQSVAARQRRHRITDRFKILQSLVPGGSKMDTVSMLEQAIQYVKFLKNQIWLHQAMISSFVDDPTISSSQPNHCSVLPFNHQELDFCDDYYAVDRVLAEGGQLLGLPESWFSGEEYWAMQS